MLAQSWKAMLAAVAAAGVIGAGAGAWNYATTAAEPPVRVAAEQPPAVPPPNPPAVPEEPTEKPGTFRTANFIVTAPSPRIARLVGEAAERHRQELAKLWLGKELPPWPRPCPVRVTIKCSGAAGATRFNYDFRGGFEVIEMELAGPLDRILASTLPHEVTHTVWADALRAPAPRWADESAATLAEDEDDRRRHDEAARRVMIGRGPMSTRKLLHAKDFSQAQDELVTFYAQGYSLTRFLVERKGHPTFLQFVRDALEGQRRADPNLRDGWDEPLRRHYGFANVVELESAWRDHLRRQVNASIAALPSIPQVASATVSKEGRLAVYHTLPASSTPKAADTRASAGEGDPNIPRYTFTYTLAPNYSVSDVRGYRSAGTSLEKLDVQQLTEALRSETPVIVCQGGLEWSARELLLKVVRDGTIVLVLPHQDGK
jgi:hypothetical protein